MRKLKRLLSILITIAVLSSMIVVPVSADITSPYEAAMFLKDRGLLQGNEDGDLMLDEQLKREQMLVILSRLAGVEDMAKEYPTDDMTFADVPEYSDYAPYIAWAQAEGITQGYSRTKFGFGDKLTGWQTKAFFVRALGYTKIADSNIESKASELGLAKNASVVSSKPIYRLDMSMLMYNTLNAKTSDGTTLGDKLGVISSKKLEMTASLISSNSIKVTFNRAVFDTNKISFEVKGSYVIGNTASWNTSKTEAVLAMYYTLPEGSYTVKAISTGDTFETGKDSASIYVAPNGANKIEFLTDKLVKDGNHDVNYRATLRYKITDNYGTDVTRSTYDSDLLVYSSKTLNSNNPFDLDSSNGIMTLNFASKLPDDGKSIVVTIISNRTNATVSQTFTVSDSEKIDNIVFKGIEYQQTSPATIKLYTGRSVAGYITFDAIDQYGSIINSKSSIDKDVIFTAQSNYVKLTTEEYIDNTNTRRVRLVIDTMDLNTARTVTVRAICLTSGKNTTVDLNISETNKAERVVLGSQQNVFAAKDPAGTFELPIYAYDQYNVQLTPDEIITNVDNGNIILNADSGFAIEIGRTGTVKGKITNTNSNTTPGRHIITVFTRSSSSNAATYPFEVREQAYEAAMSINTMPASNMLMGAVTKMNYKFFDQYGRQIKSPSSSTILNIEVSSPNVVKATVGNASTNDTNRMIVTTASAVAADDGVSIGTVTNDGTGRVTAKLLRNNQVISSLDSVFNVVRGVPSSLIFEIANIPTLPARTDDAVVNGTDKYARPIVLTAKDSYGTVYALPETAVAAVTTQNSSDTNLIKISNGRVSAPTVKAQDGYYVIGARAESVAFASGDPALKTVNIKVLVAIDNVIKDVYKSINISRDDPNPDRIVFADKDLRFGYPYGLDPEAKEISDISGTVAEVTSQKLFIYEVDQYGVYNKINSATLRVSNTDKFSGTLTYNNGDNTLDFSASQIKANEIINVMYISSNGKYGAFTIKASNGTK